MVRCWVIKRHQIKALILKKKKEVGIIPRPCPVMTSVCLWCSFPQSFSWKETYVLGNRLLLKLCYIYTLGKLFLYCIIYQLFSVQTNPNLCHSFKYVSYQEGTSCSLCFFFIHSWKCRLGLTLAHIVRESLKCLWKVELLNSWIDKLDI